MASRINVEVHFMYVRCKFNEKSKNSSIQLNECFGRKSNKEKKKIKKIYKKREMRAIFNVTHSHVWFLTVFGFLAWAVSHSFIHNQEKSQSTFLLQNLLF